MESSISCEREIILRKTHLLTDYIAKNRDVIEDYARSNCGVPPEFKIIGFNPMVSNHSLISIHVCKRESNGGGFHRFLNVDVEEIELYKSLTKEYYGHI